MSTPVAQTIEILSKEKNIDPQIIISAIEDAVASASKKHFKTGEDLRAQYNTETGEIELFSVKRVVETVEDSAVEVSLAEVEEMGIEGAEIDDYLQFPKPLEELGRIAAQTAKQIIFQKVREAERNNIYDEYIGRVGELVNGHVKRFESGGRIIIDLGKVESVLPRPNQSRAETFSQGERVRVVINNVTKDTKGPQVEVSRACPELVIRLFEMEVPEIYDGTVQVKAAMREPGERTKIAVISNARDVDPVGACVGMKGSRVQSIIRELRGEKIDIIEWSEDPSVFAANALSPAKVSRVQIVDFEGKRLEVVVDETQLSLAIGKHGQNVRLASRLIGWDIDIKNEEDMKREIQVQMDTLLSGSAVPLTLVHDLPEAHAQRLIDNGIASVEDLIQRSEDSLCELLDISLDEARGYLDSARLVIEAKQQREQKKHADSKAAEEAAEAAARDELSAAEALAAAEAEAQAAEAESSAETAAENTDSSDAGSASFSETAEEESAAGEAAENSEGEGE